MAGDVTGRLRTEFCLHPLSGDEEATCGSLVAREPSGVLTVMPTHHVGATGDLTGFRYDCAGSAPGSCLPVSRRMFFGHTLAEVQDGEDAILRLMLEPARNRARMLEYLSGVERGCVAPAQLDCVPENSDALTHRGVMQGTDLRTVDSKAWSPEVPDSIGLYHAYLRGYNRDVRAHKLFVGVSGGLEKASDAFCNLLIDVGDKWTAGEVAESEEAWWLRKACGRARCRLIKGLADAFSLRVPHIQDIQARDPHIALAIASVDTVEHDLSLSHGVVSVFSGCADTTRPLSGLLCRMQPAEGLWLFRGASRLGGLGYGFGDRRVCGAFPTSQPAVAGRPGLLPAADGSDCVVRLAHAGPRQQPKGYMCFDEAYFKTLERMQWNRDNGHVELMPIVVGLP